MKAAWERRERLSDSTSPLLKCLYWLRPITTQTCCYFSPLPTKQSPTLDLNSLASYRSIISLLYFAGGYPWKSSLCSLCQISLLPFSPKPAPVRLHFTATTLLTVPRDLRFAEYNDQFSLLIVPALSEALDTAGHFLLLDSVSALGF